MKSEQTLIEKISAQANLKYKIDSLFRKIWEIYRAKVNQSEVLDKIYSDFSKYSFVADSVKLTAGEELSSQRQHIIIPISIIDQSKYIEWISNYVKTLERDKLAQTESAERKLFEKLQKRFGVASEKAKYYELLKKFGQNKLKKIGTLTEIGAKPGDWVQRIGFPPYGSPLTLHEIETDFNDDFVIVERKK